MESRITKLPNGATFIFAQTDAPSYAIMTTMRVGHIDEIDQRPGLAHFVEHMLFQGSPALKPGELMHDYKRRFRQRTNAETGHDHTNLLCSIGSNYYLKKTELEALVPVIANAFSLEFEPDAVEQERIRIASEVARNIQAQDPEREAARKPFMVSHYGEAWMGLPYHLGDVENAQTTRRDELADFHARYYGGNRLVIACEGPSYPAELVDRLAEVIAKASAGAPFEDHPFALPAGAEGAFASTRIQENEAIAYMAIGRTAEDNEFKTVVAAEYLNDFWNKFVLDEKRGYAASIIGSYSPAAHEFIVSFPYHDKPAAYETWQRFVDHIEHTKAKPDEALFEDVKAGRADYYTRHQTTHGAKNSRNFSSYSETGEVTSSSKIAGQFEAVTLEDMHGLLNRFTAANPSTYSTCAPGQALEQPKIAEILKAAAPAVETPPAPQPEKGDSPTSASSPDRPSRYSRPPGGTAYSGPR